MHLALSRTRKAHSYPQMIMSNLNGLLGYRGIRKMKGSSKFLDRFFCLSINVNITKMSKQSLPIMEVSTK